LELEEEEEDEAPQVTPEKFENNPLPVVGKFKDGHSVIPRDSSALTIGSGRDFIVIFDNRNPKIRPVVLSKKNRFEGFVDYEYASEMRCCFILF
jgi:hypothetical protein